MRNDIKIEIEDLILIESASFPSQFLRPYRTELNGGLIERIGERLHKAKRFTHSILANLANQFIVPDTRPRGIIEIPHGWDERRGRFILTVQLRMPGGDAVRQVFMGYTNSVGFTDRRVDHEMTFYINNTYMLQQRSVTGARGRNTIYVPMMNQDVLSDRNDSGLRRGSDRRFTMRPEDIFSTLDAENSNMDVDDVTDLRVTLNRNSIKSRSQNRIGSRYMASVLNARKRAIDDDSYGGSVADVNATAQGYVQEHYPTEDFFMRYISRDNEHGSINDYFTFGDLVDIDSSIERRVNPKKFDSDSRAATNYSNMDINRNDGQEEEDRIACLISIAVPALMMECGLHKMDLQVHNQGIGGEFVVVPSNIRSFIKDSEMQQFIDNFIDRLTDELLIPITGDNRYDLGIQLTCRVFGEVDFTLFWDGVGRGRYVYPCFCSSLSSPIVTDRRDDVKDIASDFNELFEELLPNTLGGGSSTNFNF